MTLDRYAALIVGWAHDRCLVEERYLTGQFLKLAEELGEAAWGDHEEDIDATKDGIGDTFVVATIMAAQAGHGISRLREEHAALPGGPMVALGRIAACLARGKKDELPSRLGQFVNCIEVESQALGIDMLECVAMVWEIIKDRKGRMVDGVFIKENDNG